VPAAQPVAHHRFTGTARRKATDRVQLAKVKKPSSDLLTFWNVGTFISILEGVLAVSSFSFTDFGLYSSMPFTNTFFRVGWKLALFTCPASGVGTPNRFP